MKNLINKEIKLKKVLATNQDFLKQKEHIMLQKQNLEFDKTVERGKRQYEKELFEYFNYISGLSLSSRNELIKKKEDMIQLKCLLDMLSSDNEDLQRQIQESENEIYDIKIELKIYKKSINIKKVKEVINNNVIEIVCKKLNHENLLEHPKFQSFSNKNNIEFNRSLKVYII